MRWVCLTSKTHACLVMNVVALSGFQGFIDYLLAGVGYKQFSLLTSLLFSVISCSCKLVLLP